MTFTVQNLFIGVTAQLEDLHAVAIEGQRVDNSRDMQDVLNIHLRSGLVALDGAARAIANALEGNGL